MLKVEPLKRKFRYNGITLPDPDPTLSIDQVKVIFSGAHSSLVTAGVKGPTQEGEFQLWTFVPNYLDKG